MDSVRLDNNGAMFLLSLCSTTTHKSLNCVLFGIHFQLRASRHCRLHDGHEFQLHIFCLLYDEHPEA